MLLLIVLSKIVSQVSIWNTSRKSDRFAWSPQLKDWLKFKLTHLGHIYNFNIIRKILKDNHAKITMAKNKLIGNCHILVNECLAMESYSKGDSNESSADYNRKLFTESQLVVNSINSKICVAKDIINPVDDIRLLISSFRDIRIEYYKRTTNIDADAMTRRSYITFFIFSCNFSWLYLFYFKRNRVVS